MVVVVVVVVVVVGVILTAVEHGKTVKSYNIAEYS